MSVASIPPYRSAAAFNFLSAVEEYEMALGASFDAAHPETVSLTCSHLDRIRVHVAPLFELAVPWLAVLISRSEWTFAVWQAADRAEETRLLKVHLLAVRDLRTACRAAITGDTCNARQRVH